MIHATLIALADFALFAQQTSTTTTPQTDPDLSFFVSPQGATIAWVATMAGTALAILSFALYLGERGKAKGVDELLKMLEAKKKLETERQELQEINANEEARASTLRSDLERIQAEIRDKVPLQARTAFYKNAIPEIDRQLLDLSEQRKQMASALASLGEDTSIANQAVLREVNNAID